MNIQIEFLKTRPYALAYHHIAKDSPYHIVFLSGYRSDMMGTKASFFADYCSSKEYSFTRFDYSGHGQSQGEFNQLCLSDWIQDTKEIIKHTHLKEKKLIIIGSSMGAWIALKLLPYFEGISQSAFIALAPAPDFTAQLMPMRYESPYKERLEKDGYFTLSCDYEESEDYIVTQTFLDDGDRNAILQKPISYHGPVHLIQGKKDQDVPFQHVFKIAEILSGTDLKITLLENADHRLSDTDSLSYMINSLEDIISQLT